MNPLERAQNDIYLRGLFWILRERAGGGGWPPRDVNKVSGWLCVKMLAALSGHPVNAVAADVIDTAQRIENEGTE